MLLPYTSCLLGATEEEEDDDDEELFSHSHILFKTVSAVAGGGPSNFAYVIAVEHIPPWRAETESSTLHHHQIVLSL